MASIYVVARVYKQGLSALLPVLPIPKMAMLYCKELRTGVSILAWSCELQALTEACSHSHLLTEALPLLLRKPPWTQGIWALMGWESVLLSYHPTVVSFFPCWGWVTCFHWVHWFSKIKPLVLNNWRLQTEYCSHGNSQLNFKPSDI